MKITRRGFLHRTLGAAAASDAALRLLLGSETRGTSEDWYVLPGVHGKTTGWFHLENRNGRDLLVTPDGGGFLCLGINHLSSIAQDRMSAPLFRERFGGDWKQVRGEVLRQMRQWGFNTLGYGAPETVYRGLPHLLGAFLEPLQRTCHYFSSPVKGVGRWFAFPDVFDPGWQKAAEDAIGQHCQQHGDNPWLIGFRLHDAPTWDVFKTRGLRGTDWVSEIRRLGPDAPGKRRYVQFLKERHDGDLAKVTAYYGVQANSWETLVASQFTGVHLGKSPVIADDQAFLGVIADAYYRCVGNAFHRHAPNHLFFGEMFLAGDMPNEVLLAAKQHIDAVMIQQGDALTPLYTPSHVFPEEDFDRIYRITGKPILIGDHQIGFADAKHPDIVWGPPGTTEAQATQWTEDYLTRLFAKPYVIGYCRCTWMDHMASAAEGRGQQIKRGLVAADGTPHRLLVEAYRRAIQRVVERITTAQNSAAKSSS